MKNIEISKEQFKSYVKVQKSGKWNMFSPQAIEATGLPQDVYCGIIQNYSKLSQAYPEVCK